MHIRELKLKLEPHELPEGFTYPRSFLQFLQDFPEAREQFDPWGLVADVESNQLWSEASGRPLLQFAQAWHEDLLACFVVDGSADPAVVVINPWQQRMVNGKAEQYCMLVEQFPNFEEWLKWMRDSELVRDHAAARAGSVEDVHDVSGSRAERPLYLPPC